MGVEISVYVMVEVVVVVVGTPTVNTKVRCQAKGEPSPLFPMIRMAQLPETI